MDIRPRCRPAAEGPPDTDPFREARPARPADRVSQHSSDPPPRAAAPPDSACPPPAAAVTVAGKRCRNGGGHRADTEGTPASLTRSGVADSLPKDFKGRGAELDVGSVRVCQKQQALNARVLKKPIEPIDNSFLFSFPLSYFSSLPLLLLLLLLQCHPPSSAAGVAVTVRIVRKRHCISRHCGGMTCRLRAGGGSGN